jgi:hypothetical protein
MQNKPTPPEGTNSEQTGDESASYDAACSHLPFPSSDKVIRFMNESGILMTPSLVKAVESSISASPRRSLYWLGLKPLPAPILLRSDGSVMIHPGSSLLGRLRGNLRVLFDIRMWPCFRIDFGIVELRKRTE